jgi:pyruvate formate lyase activating enzyme
MLRFPVIPGISDGPDNVRHMAEFAADLKNIRDIALLPYHNTADGKYAKLKTETPMTGVSPPDENTLVNIRIFLESYGLHVHMGG